MKPKQFIKKIRPNCFLKIAIQVLACILALIGVCCILSFLMRHIYGIIAVALLAAVIVVLEFVYVTMK